MISLIVISLSYTDNSKCFIENWKSFDNWIPEIAATGGGNGEFQQYYLHPETARLINGTLQLHPRFVEEDLRGDMDLYSLACTNNWNSGCYKKGSMHWQHGELHYYNGVPIPVGGHRTMPFRSTKLISKRSFGYGKLYVKFKLPKGNFLWPAIWMLPLTNMPWPTGGEIDLMESMGNSPESGYGLDYKSVSSALHFGYKESLYPIAYSPFAEMVQEETFKRRNLSDDWHTIMLDKSPLNLIIRIDGDETLNCDKMFRAAAAKSPESAPYRLEVLHHGYIAGFRKYTEMMGKKLPEFLWKDQPHDAPFNQEFRLIVNLAVGGDFFGDSMNSGPNDIKPPWDTIEKGSHPAVQFLENFNEWYDWGDNKQEKILVPTLPWKECIKDERPCDAGKKYYLDTEKHLAYKFPEIDDKAAFHIGDIYFQEDASLLSDSQVSVPIITN